MVALHVFAVGNDARKAVADGYPVENVIAADLEAGKQCIHDDYHFINDRFTLMLAARLLETRTCSFQIDS